MAVKPKKKFIVFHTTKQIYNGNRIVMSSDKDESDIFRWGVSKEQVVARYQYINEDWPKTCTGEGYERITYVDAEEVVEQKKEIKFGNQITIEEAIAEAEKQQKNK